MSTVLGTHHMRKSPRGEVSVEGIDSRRLGAHLKSLREERKLSLGGVEALSEGFGERINKSTLHRIEYGRTVPSIARLRVLSKIYRVKLSMLLEVLESSFEEGEKAPELGVDAKSLSYEDLRRRGIEVEREGDFAKAALFYRSAWEKAEKESPSAKRSVRIAKARMELAIALKNLGRIELARDQAEAALEVWNAPVDLRDRIRLTLASIYRRLNLKALSGEILDGLLARQDSIPRDLLAGAYSLMGSNLLDREPRAALLHYRSALSSVRRTKSPYQECKCLFNVGLAEQKCGNYSRSLKAFQRAKGIADKKEFNHLVCKAQVEIGKTLYLSGKTEESRSAFREAISRARVREYYQELFLCQYYLRKLNVQEGDEPSARVAEGSLKFFSTRIEESFEELEAFRAELKAAKEDRE